MSTQILGNIGKQFKETFGKIKLALIDLSGTIHIEDNATNKAVEAIEMLRNAGIKVKFVTNTTKDSTRALHERLKKIGFKIEPFEIFSSLLATKSYVKKNGLRPYLMLEEEAKEDFFDMDLTNPNAVIIGLSPSNFCYDELNKAFKMVQSGSPLIACHKGRYFKTNSGLKLGPGPFIHALEYSTNKEAIIIGKPTKSFFMEAIEETNISLDETVMIGDDVKDDILGASKLGIKTILVKTGKYLPDDEKTIEPSFPDATLNDFYTAVNYLIAAKEI